MGAQKLAKTVGIYRAATAGDAEALLRLTEVGEGYGQPEVSNIAGPVKSKNLRFPLTEINYLMLKALADYYGLDVEDSNLSKRVVSDCVRHVLGEDVHKAIITDYVRTYL